jgi:hypothetical protein
MYIFSHKCRNRVGSKGLGYIVDSPRFELRSEQEMFLFSTRSRLAMGPAQSSVYKVPEFFPWTVKRLARKVTNFFTPRFFSWREPEERCVFPVISTYNNSNSENRFLI